MIFTSVDLPAPFSPMRAWMEPRSSVRLPERSATTGPNDLTTRCSSSAGVEVMPSVTEPLLLFEVKIPESIQDRFRHTLCRPVRAVKSQFDGYRIVTRRGGGGAGKHSRCRAARGRLGGHGVECAQPPRRSVRGVSDARQPGDRGA